MKIQAVSIDGFKNLSNVKIKFDNITALVALNNFGKSNVLDGIDFGLAFLKAPMDDKMKMMGNSDLIPLSRSLQGRPYKFEVEVATEYAGQECRVKYGYGFSWKRTEDEDPEIVDEYLKVKFNERAVKYTQLLKRDRDCASYKRSETGRCSAKLQIEPSELAVNKLVAYDDLYYVAIIKKLNGMRIYMENNLDAKRFYQPDPIIRKGLENEMIDADNLARVIYNLRRQRPDKFELLKGVYSQLFPNIENVIVKDFNINAPEINQFPENVPFIITNTFHVLFVKDKYLAQPIEFSMMSDGAKRVFMILSKIIVSSVSDISLIAIEEPENSVHPAMFQAYVQIISQLLDGCKVILTSHSPYIISYLNPSWIHVGVSRTPGVAEFFPLKKSGQKLLENDASRFHMSMGDYLFSMLADAESDLSDYLEYDADE